MIRRLALFCSVALAAAATPAAADWSGYVSDGGSGPYTSVSARWQVPSVTADGLVNPGFESAYTWVGIGGYGELSLIQIGTIASAYYPTVSVNYLPFFTGLAYDGQAEVDLTIPYIVHAGDVMTASLTCTALCTTGQTQTWLVNLTDVTAGWSYTNSVAYASSLLTDEWIMESAGGIPNYVQINFDRVAANGANPAVLTPLQFSDPQGQTSNPSTMTGGNSFSTCYGVAPTYTPCTTGSIPGGNGGGRGRIF